MGKLDRLDYKTAIPQLEKAIEAVSKETENVDIKVNAASKTVAEVDKTARTANIAAQSAAQSAQAAQTAAENAQTSATAAQTAAESAQASAATAETKATQAITDAANAKTAADNAQDSADSAASAAQTADAKATQATADAQAASTAAQSAQTSATQALSQAQTASTAAAEAKTDAQTAKTQAQAASTAASAAQTSADNAATAAATADAKAQQAITDAGRAQTAATTAETSAAQAISDAAAANTAANNAGRAASIAQAAADAAQGDIDEQKQYFWHDSEGAHILSDDSGSRMDLTGDGLEVTDANGDSVAEFGADGSRIGKKTGARIESKSTSIEAYDENGEMYFEVSEDGMSWGSNIAATTAQVASVDTKATNAVNTALSADQTAREASSQVAGAISTAESAEAKAQSVVDRANAGDFDGAKGDKGDPGKKGDKGDPGEQGIQGIPGEKGDKGDTGAQGIQGVQGIPGEKGDKGDTGAQGIQGEKGDTGAQGIPGEDGKSAYQSAIEGGMPSTTTEEQFNSDLADTPNKANTSYVDAAKSEAISTASADATAKADEAAKTATDFIQPVSTQTANDGIKVFPKAEKANPQNYLNIDNDSVDIYKDGDMVACFSGSGLTFLQNGENLLELLSETDAPDGHKYINLFSGFEGFAHIVERLPLETAKEVISVSFSAPVFSNDPIVMTPEQPMAVLEKNGITYGEVSFTYASNKTVTIDINIYTMTTGIAVEIEYFDIKYSVISSKISRLYAGRYPDKADQLILAMGNGVSAGARRNAFSLSLNGTAKFAGSVWAEGKMLAVADHNHNTAYYTKAEIETALNGKSDTGHNHDDRYYTKAETVNRITEESTTTAGSVTWKYRKRADGTLEMWGSATTTLAISTASGAIYTTASDYDIAIPAFVNTVDFITAELSGAGWADVTSFSTPPKLRLYAPTSYGSASRVLKYYMKGRWK